MSLQSWKDEFYPKPAAQMKRANGLVVIEHSLKKWTGALPENTRKHGVRYAHSGIMGDPFDRLSWMEFDAATCSLCKRYFMRTGYADSPCERCPIHKATGSSCLYVDRSSVAHPGPMIALLKRTKKWWIAQQSKRTKKEKG